MEKRVLLAALLSALFLSWYSQTVLKRITPTTQSRSVAPENTPQANEAAPTAQLLSDEEVITIESDALKLELGASSGSVRGVTLKRFLNESRTEALRFAGELPILEVLPLGKRLTWNNESRNSTSTQFSVTYQSNNYHILYSLDSGNSLLNIELTQNTQDIKSIDKYVILRTSWIRSDKMNGRQNPLELFILGKNQNGKIFHKRYISHLKQYKNVPRGTLIFSLTERYFCHAIRPINSEETDVSLLSETNNAMVSESKLSWPMEDAVLKIQTYLGPRDYFYMKKAGFAEAFHIGAIGQIGLVLLSALKVIAGATKNYGVAIIIFCGLITAVTSPFTMISFKSMKKMQELKPKIDRLMVQHKDDQAKLNKEIFTLYREHRVSPLSGCLPMLLQMPIFIALLQAISHFIELRGQPFLWIKDLSLPDRLMTLPIAIPILGHYINLLPLLMSGAMFLQSRMSQTNQPTDPNNPTAALMSGPFMSIIFGVMFYQFPSGLVLYWLSNSLMSVLIYRFSR